MSAYRCAGEAQLSRGACSTSPAFAHAAAAVAYRNAGDAQLGL
ncbi:MAG: hypothetical protein AVDCRST_MAG16-535 [uncultured Frankineae bacterium]|uniref:Uncharacterized protein n=1 Tax=uncultured Frankineae bacterium TaxID=437475 RepID=A0A6J4KVR2_9ACTN|nr:MAG: hypothetical protein AVDCRST_MAG16-535 [uncultured Frankineae bacterium]